MRSLKLPNKWLKPNRLVANRDETGPKGKIHHEIAKGRKRENEIKYFVFSWLSQVLPQLNPKELLWLKIFIWKW